ncbi:SRPBCC family protein [Sphingobacterium endophyticum]|uniref:SRPBCC family protein n=1 Tax=Sphingobacterium endophyticum TaxID=2546448 RepID=UPI001E4343E7|nr:SRPBCC family protein [Sphingobacterium endophyticum]
MKFKVLTKELGEEIYEGMVIEYIVSPILNVPLKWRTLITQVDQFKSFTDEQERGPYRYWNHYHEFIPHLDGVLMKDTVTYELPFGMIGNIAHSLLVKHKLEGIFDYRKVILNKLFNKKS